MKNKIFLFLTFLCTISCTILFSASEFDGIKIKFVNKSKQKIKFAKIYLTQGYNYSKKLKEGSAIDSIIVAEITDSTFISGKLKTNCINEGYVPIEIIFQDNTMVSDYITGFDCLMGCEKDILSHDYRIEVFDNKIVTIRKK